MYAIFWPAPYSVPPQFVQCVHKVCCVMFYPLCTPSQRVSAWVSLAAHLIAKQCKERRCKEGSLLENTEHSNNTLIEGELKTNKYIKCHQVTTDNTLILELLNSQRSYFPLSVCVCTITFAFMYIAHKFYISYLQLYIYNSVHCGHSVVLIVGTSVTVDILPLEFFAVSMMMAVRSSEGFGWRWGGKVVEVAHMVSG